LKSFAELNLPESVARALRDRKYENAMPVQAAVLDARSAGRDLLVSSQTGSGKTIAFGLALSQTLLGDGNAKFARRPHPAALVIVPTRELATQVREELGWLLQHTGMRMASFTGGTAVMGDLAALKHGVDLAIGTPGRLVDLVQRGRLQLGQLAAVVLDEADEMLDLGFREDLETLLKAAPAERRTLLLSATLPPAIRDMARQYQRDALPVDPRAEAGAPRSAPHEDIAFVAHLIAGPDRRAAVLNVLRASDAERAIVFCTTREGVGELHRYLVARGFTATAISGDRAQAERDRALDQVRRGEARVLVATNVAARGIHLPDVDLIVHADLPLNAESLTHRSGRTGRAGRKGTAVLLATATDRRKAERLLAMAHVKAVWTAPPSANQIASASAARLIEALTGDAAAVPGDRTTRVDELLAGLRTKLREAELDDGELLRRLLARELERLPAGETLRSVAIPAAGSGYAPVTDRRPVSRSEFAADSVLFRVNMGAKDKAEARWLLPLICRRGGITNREVGAIRIGPRETVFEIAGAAARDFEASAAETDPRAPHVRIERAQGEGHGPQRPRAARAPETKRPYASSPTARGTAPSEPATAARAPRVTTAVQAASAEGGEPSGETKRPPRPDAAAGTGAQDGATATAEPATAPRTEAAPEAKRPSRALAAAEDQDQAEAKEQDRPTAPLEAERAPRTEASASSKRAPRTDAPGADRGARSDRPLRVGGPRADRPLRTDRPLRADGPRADRPLRTDRPFRADGPRADRPLRTDRPLRADGPRSDRTDRPFRPDGARTDRAPRADAGGAERPYRNGPKDARPHAAAPRAYGPSHGPARTGHGAGQGRRPELAERPRRPHSSDPQSPRAPATKPAAATSRDHRPAHEDRPTRAGTATTTPFHRPGWAEEPAARAAQGNTPAFRARGARPGAPAAGAPVAIERKVHPPSHLRAPAPSRAKPRAK